MRLVHAFTLVLSSLALAACATRGGDPTADLQGADVTSRTTDAGEVIEEYRIAGQLHVVKITPPRGPTYYLVDRNGDGVLDSSEGEGPISPVQYKLLEW